MKLIYIPLAVIFSLFIFGIFYNGENFNTNLQSGFNTSDVNGTFMENGVEKSISTSEQAYSFGINQTEGILAIIIAVSIIGSLIGIHVLGSGLAEKTVSILYNTIFFYGMWFLFSVFAMEWLILIPLSLGIIFYTGLTMSYSIGIIQQINGNGS